MNALALWAAIRSPWGVALLVGAALLFSHGYAYNAGRNRAAAACDTAALQSQIEALKTQIEIARASEREAARLAAQAATRERTLAERLMTYESDLSTGGEPDVCLLGDDDVSRLRNLTR